MLLWLLLAPIPAALTRDSVQIVRSMSLSIPLVYLSALGLLEFIRLLSTLPQKFTIFKKIVLISLVLFSFGSFAYYLDLYYQHAAPKSPQDYLYGYSEAAKNVVSHQSRYPRIIFTDFFGQPYIYYLFYSRYSPSRYQQNDHYTSASLDTGKVDSLDNISFRGPTLADLSSEVPTLAIFSHDEILRQGIDKLPIFSQFIPLSPLDGYSTFYAYSNTQK
jgi:hypothetical protein